jgi:arylsulfatase A-like enzyme
MRTVTHSFATWVLLLSFAVDLLALPVEPTLLLGRHAPFRAALAATCAALAYTTAFSFVAAIPVAAVYSLVRWTGRLPRPWTFAWPLPLLALAWAVVTYVAPNPFVRLVNNDVARIVAFLLFGIWLVLATVVARSRRRTTRGIVAAFLAQTTFALSFALPSTVHREPRDLLWLCTVVAFAAFLYPIRRRLAAAPPVRVARILAALCATSFALLLVAPVLCPSWRVYAKDYGRFAERLGRFCRDLTDFDGDGYSATFGGMDCDDLDPFRNPGMAEKADGHDRNCNGVVRPASPTPAERGLAPETGYADASPGEIDRVVLITIDCFRSDVMTPVVTPRLVALASRGLSFARLYSGGARTATSLPLLMRGAYVQPTIASLLSGQNATSTAVFSYRHSTLVDNVFHGFGTLELPPLTDMRWRATHVTDLALDDLRKAPGAERHFLWAHYFDAHGPRALRALPSDTPRFPPMAGESESSESKLYLSELSYIDHEVGRLIDGIDESPFANRTMIIVTGDHGEGFGSHNVHEHGSSPFEQIIHVPGILVAPGISPGIYAHVVSHRDIVATVLGAFGLVSTYPHSEDFGRSWLRLRAAPQSPLHDFVITYSASAHVDAWSDAPLAVRTDDHAKLAVAYRDGIERYYHLDSVAGELRDLTYDLPDEVARDRRELELYRDIDSPPP